MQNFRIGNDLPIEWRLYRLGEPEILQNHDVSIRLFDSYMKPVPFIYKIEGNAVSGIFAGRDQKRTGAYTLKLVKNYGKEEMTTIDEVNVFSLVTHSYQEGGSADDPGVTINRVNYTSELTTPVNGKSAYVLAVEHGWNGSEEEWLESLIGKSVYDIYLDNGGTLTESEWLDSLKGVDGVDGQDGKSAYDIIKEHGYQGTEAEWVADMQQKVVTSSTIGDEVYDIENADNSSVVLYTPQELSTEQQTTARENIGAVSKDGLLTVEDPDIEAMIADPTLLTSAVRTTPQIWSERERAQAQENIGVADVSRTEYLEEKMRALDASGLTVIGDITTLKTTNKDYIVNAINENWDQIQLNKDNIGTMPNLTIVDSNGYQVTNLVDAINILKNSNGMSIVEEPIPNSDMVKTYSIYNGVDAANLPLLVGQIDLPLDKVAIKGEMIVADGTEVIGTDDGGNSIRAVAGKNYIVITVENEAKKIYISLAGVDYTAKQPDATIGETVLQVQVAVDATKREISATIGEDMVTHTELDKQTEHELDFTGYDHNKDDDTHADYNKPQLSTTAQTLAGGVNELDELQGDATNLPFRDVSDPADPKYPTITENIKKLYDTTQGGIKYEAVYDTYVAWETDWRIRTFAADEEDGNPIRLFQIKQAYSEDAVDVDIATGNMVTTASRTYQNNWFILGKYNATTTRYDWTYIDNPDGLLGKLDNLKTDNKLNLVLAINELWTTKGTTHVVDVLPDIADTTVLADVSERDIYILHETFDVLGADGNKVQATNADGTPKVDADGVTPIYEQEDYYTPYRLNDDRNKWLCLYHRHEHETTAIDFDADITW